MSWLAGLFGDPFEGGQSMWTLPNSSEGLAALQGQMTFNRMAMTMMAGVSGGIAAFGSAGNMDTTMEREAEASRKRAQSIREQSAQIMGAQAVGFAASGVDPTSGSAARVTSMTFGRGVRSLGIERDNAALAMMRAGWRAAAYRGAGINGLLSAGMNAYGQYMDYATQTAIRG